MRLKNLVRRKYSLKLVPFILIFLITSSLIIFYFPPTFQIHTFQYQFSILYPFIASLFCFLYFLALIILKSKKRGFLIALFVVVYLLFRLNKLNDPIFLILLIALFLVIEFIFPRKQT